MILLIGPSGAGKSTFAAKHFLSTEVVSSDRCRGMLVDDEADQSISGQAFALLRHIARVRLEHRRLTVIDATNLTWDARRPLLDLAAHASLNAIAIIFDIGLEALLANNQSRHSRVVPSEAVVEQVARLASAIPRLASEGYQSIYRLDEASIPRAVVERRPVTSNE